MILSVTFSKPVKNISQILGDDFIRIKAKLSVASQNGRDALYFVEFYTQKQVFHKKWTEAELTAFIDNHGGTSFKSVVERTDCQEITILANKKGKITRLEKSLGSGTGAAALPSTAAQRGGWSGSGTADGPTVTGGNRDLPFNNLLCGTAGLNKKKNHILKEGVPVPFLVLLGIMTAEGKVVASKYDKFRQINRFLELVDDVLPEVLKLTGNEPLTIVDFGSGKSYLTFAIQYFLTSIRGIPCRVFGLDLKKDVIDYCNSMAQKLSLDNLSFAVGNIADFENMGESSGRKNPDIIVTLHACDTATDYALDYAVKHGAKAILSVPCCQHELNLQLKKNSGESTVIAPMMKYGIIKERFAALLTDTIRAELLEENGYKVQILEFIDAENTPKNLMIRAVQNKINSSHGGSGKNDISVKNIMEKIGISQTLSDLLTKQQ